MAAWPESSARCSGVLPRRSAGLLVSHGTSIADTHLTRVLGCGVPSLRGGGDRSTRITASRPAEAARWLLVSRCRRRSNVQGPLIRAVRRIHIGARLEQAAHNVGVVLAARVVQRRDLAQVRRMRVRTPDLSAMLSDANAYRARSSSTTLSAPAEEAIMSAVQPLWSRRSRLTSPAPSSALTISRRASDVTAHCSGVRPSASCWFSCAEEGFSFSRISSTASLFPRMSARRTGARAPRTVQACPMQPELFRHGGTDQR